jgi:hypothetical protein
VIKPGIAMAAITILAASFPAISVARHEQMPDAQRSLNLVGEIMDSRCAIEGSHEKMMRQNGLKNAKDCTLKCAKKGWSFVLIDPEAKTVYQLDDQQRPEPFAGQRVRVSGHTTSPQRPCTSSP